MALLLSIEYLAKSVYFRIKAGNLLVTPLVLRVTISGGNRLPSADSCARLFPKPQKKNYLIAMTQMNLLTAAFSIHLIFPVQLGWGDKDNLNTQIILNNLDYLCIQVVFMDLSLHTSPPVTNVHPPRGWSGILGACF